MFSFKEFLNLQEIASDSWLTPPLEPIGSMKTRLDPVMAPSKRIRHSKKMKKI